MERPAARLDPPNVLWYFGALTLGFAAYGLIETIPPSRSGLWILLTSLGFVAGFAVAAVVLRHSGWWAPGGLAAALAVAVFPAFAVAFLELIGVWPDARCSSRCNGSTSTPSRSESRPRSSGSACGG